MPSIDAEVHDISLLLREITGFPQTNAFAVCVPKTKRIGGHITSKGISKIRNGNHCDPYYSVEDDYTKIPRSDLAVSDLSSESIQWAIEKHRKKFNLRPNHWEGHADFLTHIGVVERHITENEATPRYRVLLAGLLLFGKQAAIKREFESFETVLINERGNFCFRKNIVEIYKELCASKNAALLDLCPYVPVRTLKELLINAFIHRSYRANGPIIVRHSANAIEIESPGELPHGIHADNLINCVPVYRNFLLAEAARYLGLCDKIGERIDLVYKTVLETGFGFPSFESREGKVNARVPTGYSREFREFVRKRSQALTQLDELMVLRLLWDKGQASTTELYSLMQRGPQFGQNVLDNMFRKTMIETVDGDRAVWRLNPVVRKDIETIFQRDQMSFETNLFGDM